MKKVVFQDYVHHLSATPIEIVGQWHVFNSEDIPDHWPTERTHLAVEVNDTQLQYLRDYPISTPVVPTELPLDPVEEEVILN